MSFQNQKMANKKSNFYQKPGKIVELKGNYCPRGRYRFGLCSSKHDIYIYGGCGYEGIYLDDLWHINGI